MKAYHSTLPIELHLTFTQMSQAVYDTILEEVISGIDRGELKNLLEKLDDVNLPQYRELLKVEDPNLFNFYLWNAIIDAFFTICTALTVD